MSENSAWLATDDPTNGELPATEFIGSKKDLTQTQEPQEGDGQAIAEVDEEARDKALAENDQDPSLAAKTETEQKEAEK